MLSFDRFCSWRHAIELRPRIRRGSSFPVLPQSGTQATKEGEIRLETRDEFGRVMTPKEAFQQMFASTTLQQNTLSFHIRKSSTWWLARYWKLYLKQNNMSFSRPSLHVTFPRKPGRQRESTDGKEGGRTRQIFASSTTQSTHNCTERGCHSGSRIHIQQQFLNSEMVLGR